MTGFHGFAKSAGDGDSPRFPKCLTALCAVLLGAGTAQAAATYTTEDGGATLVVTVDADGTTLDSSQIAAAITKIAKRGPGKLTSVDISTYTGDFDIEEGIWCCTDSNQFGATNTTADSGTIYVRAGASIEYAGTNKRGDSLSGKTVHLYGAGAAGATQSAKIFLTSDTTMSDPGFGKNVKVMMHDDTLFYSKNRLKITGVFDLGGNKLTLYSNAHDLCGSVTNGGAIVLSNRATFMTEGGSVAFAPDCAENAYIEITSGSTLNLKSKQSFANGWTIKNDGGAIVGNTYFPSTKTDFPVWAGPVELSGASKIANYTGSTSIPTTVFNLKEGPISGSGTLAVGPGWLNLHVQENGYSGAVSVTSVGNAVVPAGAGGIGACGGAPVFTNASSITFNDSARFEFMDAVPAKVGALTFAGDGEQSIRGGAAENRSTIAGLTKTGDNTLVVSSPAHFAGPAAISGGVLKIPYRSVRGTPGLVESHATPKTVDTWADIQYIYEPEPAYYKIFIPWNSTYLSHCNVTEKGVCTVGAQRAYKGMINTANVNWSDGYIATLPSGKSGRNVWWYSGYVWNNTDAPATYTVWTSARYGSAIWLGEDHSTSIQLKPGEGNTQHGKEVVDAQEITLQPGATKIDIVIAGERDEYWCLSVPSNANRPGLVYAPTSACTAQHLNELIVDYYDNASTASTNALSAALSQFSEFKDEGGIGELFTTDVYSDADADKKTALLPVFDDLRFENGATLDLGNNLDFVVKDLTGSPNVENAVRFTVTNNWTICSADFPRADASVRRPMAVAGKLVFAEGATFSVDDEAAIERSSEGVVVATATDGIVGCPAQAAGGRKKWKLFTSGNSLRLRFSGGFMVMLR